MNDRDGEETRGERERWKQRKAYRYCACDLSALAVLKPHYQTYRHEGRVMNPSALCVCVCVSVAVRGKALCLEWAQQERAACWAERTPEDNWQFASTGCSFSLMRSPAAFDNWVAVVGESSPDRGPSQQLAPRSDLFDSCRWDTGHRLPLWDTFISQRC